MYPLAPRAEVAVRHSSLQSSALPLRFGSEAESSPNLPEKPRDAVVIGAGPGGYASAIRMAQMGLKVAVVEKDTPGGVCLNVGCIPSKALIYVGKLFEKIKNGAKMGILVDNPRVDMATVNQWKNGIVQRLSGGVRQLLNKNNIETITGTAKFTDANTLEVTGKDGKTQAISAKNFVIATGSHIFELPSLKYDHKVVIDSTDALDLKEVPKHMILIGGGIIGLELGMAYAKLGAKVTVVEVQPKLLNGMDPDIVDTLMRSLKKNNIELFLSTKPTSLTVEGEEATLVMETPQGPKTLQADKVLVAVGRRPNSKNLGLENAGVTLNQYGAIPVNSQLRTNVSNIFAIGDVTPGAGLAHRAANDGLVAAEVIAGKNVTLDGQAIPSAIFTDPEIATVGDTEEQAKTKGHEVKVGKFPFAASGKATTMNDIQGFVKVIADAKSDKVLGVHMVGPDVSELIAEGALAIRLGATTEALAKTIHAHPTLPESLMEAAEAVDGRAIHFYQGKRALPSSF